MLARATIYIHYPINTYDSEILKRSSLLNVLQCLLQIFQLQINTALSLLRVLHSLRLKSLNCLNLPRNIVGRRLEGAEVLLDLVNDSLVLQDRAVVGEVDSGRLFRKSLDTASGIFAALLEGLKGGCGLATKT
jgi:hypothetical protein